jgi:spore coat polysaccharide biosynthesis protein SpsF (cytidylyltransferase family)
MKIVTIIQVRMDSKSFPNKVMGYTSMIELLLNRLPNIINIEHTKNKYSC